MSLSITLVKSTVGGDTIFDIARELGVEGFGQQKSDVQSITSETGFPVEFDELFENPNTPPTLLSKISAEVIDLYLQRPNAYASRIVESDAHHDSGSGEKVRDLEAVLIVAPLLKVEDLEVPALDLLEVYKELAKEGYKEDLSTFIKELHSAILHYANDPSNHVNISGYNKVLAALVEQTPKPRSYSKLEKILKSLAGGGEEYRCSLQLLGLVITIVKQEMSLGVSAELTAQSFSRESSSASIIADAALNIKTVDRTTPAIAIQAPGRFADENPYVFRGIDATLNSLNVPFGPTAIRKQLDLPKKFMTDGSSEAVFNIEKRLGYVGSVGHTVIGRYVSLLDDAEDRRSLNGAAVNLILHATKQAVSVDAKYSEIWGFLTEDELFVRVGNISMTNGSSGVYGYGPGGKQLHSMRYISTGYKLHMGVIAQGDRPSLAIGELCLGGSNLMRNTSLVGSAVEMWNSDLRSIRSLPNHINRIVIKEGRTIKATLGSFLHHALLSGALDVLTAPEEPQTIPRLAENWFDLYLEDVDQIVKHSSTLDPIRTRHLDSIGNLVAARSFIYPMGRILNAFGGDCVEQIHYEHPIGEYRRSVLAYDTDYHRFRKEGGVAHNLVIPENKTISALGHVGSGRIVYPMVERSEFNIFNLVIQRNPDLIKVFDAGTAVEAAESATQLYYKIVYAMMLDLSARVVKILPTDNLVFSLYLFAVLSDLGRPRAGIPEDKLSLVSPIPDIPNWLLEQLVRRRAGRNYTIFGSWENGVYKNGFLGLDKGDVDGILTVLNPEIMASFIIGSTKAGVITEDDVEKMKLLATATTPQDIQKGSAIATSRINL